MKFPSRRGSSRLVPFAFALTTFSVAVSAFADERSAPPPLRSQPLTVDGREAMVAAPSVPSDSSDSSSPSDPSDHADHADVVVAGAVQTDTPPDADKAPSSDGERQTRFGPMVGVGFPRPIAIEAVLKVNQHLALGAEYGFMPKLTIGGVETKLWGVAGSARIFPFGGAFFIGVRGGFQKLDASASVTAGSYGTFTESATAEATFINPRIGFLWTHASGLSAGIDVGLQIPLSTSLTTTLPKNVPVQVDSTIASVADTLGNGVTPTLDLLRVGILF